LHKDVEAALWAWVNFGGIGARTRRGCGALFCAQLAPKNLDDVGRWFQAHSKKYELAPAGEPAWPILANLPRIAGRLEKPQQAWISAIAAMRTFRQGEGVGRNPGVGGRPGRSRWPEADSIRALTGAGDPKHMEPVTIKDAKTHPAFPRARFGLPIVFHFKGEPIGTKEGVELYPKLGNEQFTRMSSPLILRPLGVGDGTQAVPMILRLRAPGPVELRLTKGGVDPVLSLENIDRKDLAAYPNSPLKPKATSALDAFLLFAETRGFKKVVLA
jgi:CRISPR-associated protein Cmr1